MQLGWLYRGLRSGILTTRYPREPVVLPDGFRGMPLLDPLRCRAANGCDLCQRACLPNAITIQESTTGGTGARIALHYGRCILCELCVSTCPHQAMSMIPQVELSVRRADDLIFVADLNGTKEHVANAAAVVENDGRKSR